MRENGSVALGLSGELLPVHPILKPDELLSSWICRLAIAHNVKPSGLLCTLGQRNQSADLDRYPSHNLLEVLKRKTGTSVERIRAATLGKYLGTLHVRRIPKGPLPWLLPMAGLRRASPPNRGMQACSICLAEDSEPYYRIIWRLAFVTACPGHSVRLLDRCPRCLGSIEYVRNASQLKPQALALLTVCAKCGFDLRKASKSRYLTQVTPRELAFQKQLLSGLEDKWISIQPHTPIYSHLFFEGLAWILSILYGGRGPTTIRRKLCEQYHLPASTAHVSQKPMPAFYKYNAVDRNHLVGLATCLLLDWPGGFIKFCTTNRLGSFRLLKGPRYVPYWLWKVIHDHLDESEYFVSEKEFLSIVKYLRRLGLTVNKQSMSKYIGRVQYERLSRLCGNGSDRKQRLIRECPRCHVTGPQPTAGLSSSGDQRFRCIGCGRTYTVGKCLRSRSTKETRIRGLRMYEKGRGVADIARVLSAPTSVVQWWITH
jgi:hypothetical protein